ncbi:MAG: ABC transporter ATP-binding protein [Treponema sp.]|jgi:ABC-type multidrug transport system ATPase subunit|nr:ABC transporter ATP-binding protein [Treponema sp.]
MVLSGIEKKLGDFSLSVDNLEVSYPGIYGLIGPNGSGKSTLAKLMAGLLELDKGRIETVGLGYRDITFLPRKPYLLDDTVYNNLVYPLKLRKIKPDPDLVTEYLERMGLSKRGKQKARSLSGGEQQKLAFLRALIFKPRLIIADEALAALDIDSLDLFENLILEEQKKCPIIWIFISHQMPHIRRLCNNIFFMYQGRIESSGGAEEIFSRQSNSHLKQYLRVYGGGE